MKFILLQLLWAGRKIAQIGQTERKQGAALLSVTRSCTSSQYVSQSSKSNKSDFSQVSQLLLSQKKVMTFF